MEFIKAKEEYSMLRVGALQRRIALEHRMGCIKYALGYDQSEIIRSFERAADLIPGLLRHGSIEPSLALSAWGICFIAGRRDVLDILSMTESERLRTQHVQEKYIKMIANIFRANQKSWKSDVDGVVKEITEYDRLLARRRTNRMFERWAQGLRDMHMAHAQGSNIPDVIAARIAYLNNSYPEDQIDHESLLDVHGMGVFGASSLGGWRMNGDGSPFPVVLHAMPEGQ